MRSKYYLFKQRALELRRAGRTYGEIKKITGQPIPKSTLSSWFCKVTLSRVQQERLRSAVMRNIKRAQKKAWMTNKRRRKEYIQSVRDRVKYLSTALFNNKDARKIALAMLYLAEGGKNRRGGLVFGNSDARTVQLFLGLLRSCYSIDEEKFRCTLQCRADQDTKKLERFWSRVTGIPSRKFYKALVDPRTIGRPSQKPNYKGVCRIDYFSGDTFMEIKQIIEVIFAGL